jgi:hypothetical protein
MYKSLHTKDVDYSLYNVVLQSIQSLWSMKNNLNETDLYFCQPYNWYRCSPPVMILTLQSTPLIGTRFQMHLDSNNNILQNCPLRERPPLLQGHY